MTNMTANRFRACLDAMGWSQRGLADRLDINFVTVQRWANGRLQVPAHIAGWLDTLAQVHEANPAPQRPVWIKVAA
jgi:transcriptional regulator with XRE-family HTH domain